MRTAYEEAVNTFVHTYIGKQPKSVIFRWLSSRGEILAALSLCPAAISKCHGCAQHAGGRTDHENRV